MSIPLISNVGFTEINSAGSLTTAAGAKIALPVQLFKLTDNITGQLTLTENANHKKVIIDTNGNNITNETGSPLNVDCPSGVPVELKGSGNVRSNLKTFTSAVTDTTNTATTTIATAGNSTLAVSTSHTFTEQTVDINKNAAPDKRSYRVSFEKFYSLAPSIFTPKITLSESIKRIYNGLINYSEEINKDRSYLIRLNVLKSHRLTNKLDMNLFWVNS